MFPIVLVEPEIPNNTGCVGRTVLGAGAQLHLVEPLGFEIDDRAVKRAGLDYWPQVPLSQHSSFEGFVESEKPVRMVAFSKKADRSIYDFEFQPGDHLIFGKESVGLSESITDRPDVQNLRIPIANEIRSLNLSVAVGIALYEAIRQQRSS